MKKIIPALLLLFTLCSGAMAAPDRSYLKTDEVLRSGEALVSNNRAFFATVEPDGNLAVYRGSAMNDNFGVLWRAGAPTAPSDFFLIVQSDGNLVIYRGTGPADNRGYHWSTRQQPRGESFLIMQDDGNLVQYAGPSPDRQGRMLWQSGPTSPVNWLSGGKYFQNAAYEDIQNGYLFNGVNPSNLTPGTWLGHVGKGQRWKLGDDGVIRSTAPTGKCLQPNRYHLDVMVARYGWREFGLELADCNSPELRPGWRFVPVSTHTVAIRHDLWPAGCLQYMIDDDGNLAPMFFLNTCWLPGMEGLDVRRALQGQWIIR